MQRTLNNLLTIVVIGVVMTTASMSMARGGGGHGGGHSGGHSSHASRGHASGQSHHANGNDASSGHKNKTNKTNKNKNTNGKKNKKTKKTNGKKTSSKKNNKNKKNKKNKNKHRRHHRRYPKRFWYGGDDDGGDGDDGDSEPAEYETAAVSPTGVDVSFASIRQLDAGDPDNNLGPSYRVWITNNSPVAIDTPFDVALLASNDGKMSEGLPYGSVEVEGMEAGETQALDIRLPVAAMTMDGQGDDAGAYSFVHAVVDSQNVLTETDKKNNIAVFNDDDIPQIDE